MTQSKSIFFTLAVLVLLAASCKKDNNPATEGQFDRSVSATTPDNRLVPAVRANIPNVINANRLLDKDTLWILNGPTFVTGNATLTIEAGAFIKGQLRDSTANNYPSFLLVTRGAKLIANGTAAAPIVFTSIKAANARAKGNWGGVVLLGNGTTNVGEWQIEGVRGVYAHALGLDSTTVFKYGNTSDADNSGSLKNVRIEFAGDVISEGNELNGLTLGGVGYNTCLENIQVSHGADDGFEFFGGAVNAKDLISYANDDDDFDFDQGYVGNIQFGVALKYTSLGLSSSPNSIESNNVTAPVVTGGPFASKRTRPTLSNFTLLGRNTAGSPQPTTGALFRAGSAYNVRNFAVGGFNYGVDLSGGFASGSEFSYSVLHGFLGAVNGLPLPTNYSPFTGATANTDLKLLNPFNLPNPNFNYADVSGNISPVKNRANFTSWPGSFSGICLTSFTTTTYAGAFPANAGARWDATWSSYSALTNPYTP